MSTRILTLSNEQDIHITCESYEERKELRRARWFEFADHLIPDSNYDVSYPGTSCHDPGVLGLNPPHVAGTVHPPATMPSARDVTTEVTASQIEEWETWMQAKQEGAWCKKEGDGSSSDGLHKQIPRRVHVSGERREAILGINAPVSRSLGRHSFRRCLWFPRLPQVLILGRHFLVSRPLTYKPTQARRCICLQLLLVVCFPVSHLRFTAPLDEPTCMDDLGARTTQRRDAWEDLKIWKLRRPVASGLCVLCGATVSSFELRKCARGRECQICYVGGDT